MLHRPYELPEREYADFDAYVDDLRTEIDEAVERVLGEIHIEPLGEHVARTIFRPNDHLPKRIRRPKAEVALLTEQTARAFDVPADLRETLLGLGLCIAEYYDVFDDVVDDDVADGSRPYVVTLWQVLHPVVTRLVHRLGDDATSYWTTRGIELMEAPLVGVLEEPSGAVYEEILNRQADLFGGLTGLCAVVSPDDAASVSAAERVGRSFFAFEQLLLDGEQYAPGEEPSWNAWGLFSEDEVYELLRHWQDEYRSAIEGFPDDQQRRLRPLTSIDFEIWERRSLST